MIAGRRNVDRLADRRQLRAARKRDGVLVKLRPLPGSTHPAGLIIRQRYSASVRKLPGEQIPGSPSAYSQPPE